MTTALNDCLLALCDPTAAMALREARIKLCEAREVCVKHKQAGRQRLCLGDNQVGDSCAEICETCNVRYVRCAEKVLSHVRLANRWNSHAHVRMAQTMGFSVFVCVCSGIES